MEKKKLLIVEDEIAIRDGLVDVFVFHGFDVTAVDNGNDGLQKALTGQFHMVLLDVMLPGMNGFDVCEAIREQDRAQPIIMLTAKSSDEDIIFGLRLGADDYVAKPFSVTQLVARVEAVLRRAGPEVTQSEHIALNDGSQIDTLNLCHEREGEKVQFSRREMDMLQYLAQHHERPVPREELLHKVWGYAKNLDLETRTVDIHIAKLRRKIEADAKNPEHLITVRGGGYRLMVAG